MVFGFQVMIGGVWLVLFVGRVVHVVDWLVGVGCCWLVAGWLLISCDDLNERML